MIERQQQKTIQIVPWQHKKTMKVAIVGADEPSAIDFAKELNNYLQCKYLAPPEQRDIMMPKYWQMLAQRKAEEDKIQKSITGKSVFNFAADALIELSDTPTIQHDLMDYATECTIHAAVNYDVVFTLPYFPEPSWVMPAKMTMKQLMIEHMAALGGQIFVVYQVQGITPDERLSECVDVVSKMEDMRIKMQARENGQGEVPKSNEPH